MRIEHWWFTVPLRLRSILRGRRVERELDEELQFHLEHKIEEGIAAGALAGGGALSGAARDGRAGAAQRGDRETRGASTG